ncbi:MAG TPA: glucose-1-phosphate adenylyltransferase subunit GlgD [Defluviitaleaceae bacterium]|nr:glucose-1-phosphate adenylyltransferase subunit GlgD [Defluviitaleaceae bacterium]
MKALGIILAGGSSETLSDYPNKSIAALPVGGSYRTIDFTMSNMTNSGVNKVAVITQYSSRSLLDHLSSAKWWDLGRKQGGLFVFTPYITNDNPFGYRGTADAMYRNISFLKRSNEPFVIIASGKHVYKIDFNDVLEYHQQKQADITVIYKEASYEKPSNYGVMVLDENKRLIEFEEKPLEPQTNIISLGIYVIPRTLLIKLLEDVVAENRYDFVNDVIIRYRKKLKIYGYPFEGYWRCIRSIQSFFDINMDFLNKDVRDLFCKQYPYIATKVMDEPPAKFNIGSSTKNCIVGGGSILNGYVENAVLFRKVFTGSYSFIKNAIIMDGSYIGNNCYLEYVVLDKEVVVSDGRKLVGSKENPIFLEKGSVI